jgi:hypothetical protein
VVHAIKATEVMCLQQYPVLGAIWHLWPFCGALAKRNGDLNITHISFNKGRALLVAMTLCSHLERGRQPKG